MTTKAPKNVRSNYIAIVQCYTDDDPVFKGNAIKTKMSRFISY